MPQIAGFWSIYVPEATENIEPNPSFELNTSASWANLNGGVKSVISTTAKRENYCLQVALSSNVASGIAYTTPSIPTVGVWSCSFDINAPLGVPIVILFQNIGNTV